MIQVMYDDDAKAALKQAFDKSIDHRAMREYLQDLSKQDHEESIQQLMRIGLPESKDG